MELIRNCIKTSKNIDEYVVLTVIKSCFGSKIHYDKCFELIKLINSSINTLSHTFWQECIEGFTRSNEFNYACELIKLYPIKFSYSENMWRSFIKTQMTQDTVLSCFNLLKLKFQQRTIHDEYKSFDIIFNIYLEELTLAM